MDKRNTSKEHWKKTKELGKDYFSATLSKILIKLYIKIFPKFCSAVTVIFNEITQKILKLGKQYFLIKLCNSKLFFTNFEIISLFLCELMGTK